MQIVIAPDSFKECLSAKEVAHHISLGVRMIFPEAQLHLIPISDGGEGLLEAIMEGNRGRLVKVDVLDPLMRKIEAPYGILDDGKTAIIEMAKASGLELLEDREKDPLHTSTFGTGQLIKDALDKGCKKIIIGIGGSATNDGGMGMLSALGAKFLDINGTVLKEGGGSLHNLHHIDLTNFDPRIKQCEVVVACDVSNPLTGPNGASMVYGGQKGGDALALKRLDANLSQYANVVKSTLGSDISDVPGAGAAGGTGAGLMAFMNGTLVNGIALLLEILDVEQHVQGADLIFTGEGKIDAQTLNGKTIAGIAKMAKKYDIPVIAIAGKIGENIDRLYDIGITAVYPIVHEPMSLEKAIQQAPTLIQNCVSNVMRIVQKFYRAR